MRYLIAVLLLAASPVTSAFSQTKHDFTGKNFWVAFPQNAQTENGSQLRLSIAIVGDSGTRVKIDMQGKTKLGKIPHERFLELTVDSAFEVRVNDQTASKGILVEADHNVSVFVFDSRQMSSDSYAAIPTTELGTEYVVAGYDVLSGAGTSFMTQCDVIATENNTRIHCTVPARSEGSPVQSWDFFLKRGEVYQLRNHDGINVKDLTGLRISSNNPVAFLTGHQCAQVPADVSYCNVLVEQEPSIDNLGSEYIAPKLEMKDKYSVRVVSTAPETELSINDVHMKTLASGESYTCDALSASSVIRTSHPSLVCEYIQSHEADKQMTGDPSMFILSSAPNFIKECSVFVPHTPTGQLAVMEPDSRIESDGATRRYVRPKQLSILDPISGTSKTLAIHAPGVSLLPPNRIETRIADAPEKLFNASANSSRTIQFAIKEAPSETSTPPRVLGDERWQHFLTVVMDNAQTSTIAIDGAAALPISTENVPNTNFKVLQFKIDAGAHKITGSSPFALYAYGFGMDQSNYDAYAHSAGQMLNVVVGK